MLEKLLHVYTCQINTPLGTNSKINHTCHCRNLSQHSIKILIPDNTIIPNII